MKMKMMQKNLKGQEQKSKQSKLNMPKIIRRKYSEISTVKQDQAMRGPKEEELE